jgi:hypothetical protein
MNTDYFPKPQSHFEKENDDSSDSDPEKEIISNTNDIEHEVVGHVTTPITESVGAASGDELSDLDVSHPDYVMLKSTQASE